MVAGVGQDLEIEKKKGMAGRLCIIFGSGDSGFFSKNAAPPWWAVSFPPRVIIREGGKLSYLPGAYIHMSLS